MNNFSPSGELETPYAKAKQVWDDRMGIAREQVQKWRLIAFSALGLATLLGMGLIYVGAQAKIVPYVIEIDKIGQIRAIGAMGKQNYEPGEAVIVYFLQRFIGNVRSLSKDPVIVRKSWTEAYNVLSLSAANIMENLVKEHSPIHEVGKKSKTVEINSILRLSKNSFQAEWIEHEYDNAGTLLSLVNYRGVFNIVIQQPQNEPSIKKNPLGIFIDHFSWQRI